MISRAFTSSNAARTKTVGTSFAYKYIKPPFWAADSSELRIHKAPCVWPSTALLDITVHNRNIQKKYYLPSINCKSGHHVSWIPLLLTHVNSFSPPAHVWMPRFHYVGWIDKNVGIDISSIDPFASKVFWEQTCGFHSGGSDGFEPHSFGGFFHSF